MSVNNYRRIIYSPEVQVYIQPSIGDPIDISQDIIGGSITRRTEAVSTAQFLVQSRRKKDNTLILKRLRPMDRIVVYLKKVKPILIFSGYLDMVPLFQAVPEPVVIEASCTLKKLEFTYWDPQLPQVQKVLESYGFVPQSSGGGISFFDAPDDRTPTAGGPRETAPGIQDTGFGSMLYFLLHDVGGWPNEKIWIEPLPQQWIERATMLFQVRNDWEERYNTALSFVEKFLTSGGTGSGDTGGGDGAGATLGNSNSVAEAITQVIKKYPGATVTADDFIKAGEKYNIDPRFLVAISIHETGIGTSKDPRAQSQPPENDMFGMSDSQSFASHAASIMEAARWFRKNSPYLGGNPNQTGIQGAAAWNQGDQNSHAVYEDAFVKDWRSMASTNAPVDPNKVYSITGQNIGSSSGGGGARVNQDSSSTTTGGSSNDKLSVRIEVGHGHPRMPGYEPMVGGPNEIQRNEAVQEVIKNMWKNSEFNSFRDKIQIDFVKTSNPEGFAGDIYLSLHHDDGYRSSSGVKIGRPSSNSKTNNLMGQKNPADMLDKSVPNQYGYSGWKSPTVIGGRIGIANDEGLKINSKRFSNELSAAFSRYSQSSLDVSESPTYQPSGDNRATNYYGFYYSNAAVCALLELPKSYDVNKIASSIISAIIGYFLKHKNPTKPNDYQKQVNAGTPYNGATGQITDGDDSKASKLIKLCGYAAQQNQNNKRNKYESPGTRNKNLSDCVKDGDPMDCSGYIYNGFKEIGLNESGSTTTLWANRKRLVAAGPDKEGKKSKLKAGMFFLKGRSWGEGQDGHVVLVLNKDGTCAHCTTTSDYSGPQFTTAENYFDREDYDLIEHEKVGTTDDPPTGFDTAGTGGGGDSSTSPVDATLIAKKVAFNVAFNFPGTLLEAVTLTGERALENDVKLLETVAEVCKSSMRTFASLPNGDFIAWYPDYFNLTGRNPWLKISPVEIKSCSISLSDKQLVTHVYVIGNPYGFNLNDAQQVKLEWLQKIMGAGVVTIERPWVLDSFLRPFADMDPKKGVARPALESQGAVYKFLERYGARPYFEKIPTIRHPIFEFFYAYHTFIQMWAEQFISRVELTFMPELLPGMIAEIKMNPAGLSDPGVPENVTFYVKEVTHNFSYDSGFSTEAILIAPGHAASDREESSKVPNDWSLVMVRPPLTETSLFIEGKAKPKSQKTKQKKTPPKRQTQNNRRRVSGGAAAIPFANDGEFYPGLSEDDD